MAHQSLYPFAIDLMTQVIERYHHPSTAVKRAAGILLINQITLLQRNLVYHGRLTMSVHCRASYPDQFALPYDSKFFSRRNPGQPCYGRLIPDFF